MSTELVHDVVEVVYTPVKYDLSKLSEYEDYINGFDFDKPICIDIESISFKDDEPALRPYNGHRISTVLIGQKGMKTVEFPIRHRTETNLFPFDQAIAVLRKFCLKIRFYLNQNPKFDMRFFAQDDIRFDINCKVLDTQVLARLCRSDLMRLNLEFLTNLFRIKHVKSDAAKQWTKLHSTQDYGAIPHEILIPYGKNDVDATIGLYEELIMRLPPETMDHWQTECRFTRLLFECEDNGLEIDKTALMRKRISLLQDIIKFNKAIIEVIGDPLFNPKSHTQVDRFFTSCGVEPLKLTDEGGASWDANVLALINKIDHGEKAAKVASLIIDLNEASIQESTFCAGWCGSADSKATVHPDFRQAGTKTGRLSCGEPNAQNFPEWMMDHLVIPKGMVGIKWDLSQIEYRLFTHYSNNPNLLAAYTANKWVDYHQIMATALGIPRKPVKPINFGILYGMGKKKLKASLIKVISENDNQELRNAIQKFIEDPIPPYPEAIPSQLASSIAEAVLHEYHRNIPEIKSLNSEIKRLLGVRGYIKNYFGRRIYLPTDKAYIALNALIQGGAADLFKNILVHAHSECKKAYIVDNIHDADMSVMYLEDAQRYINSVTSYLESLKFKVPILAEFEIAEGKWSNSVKLDKNTNDVMKGYNELLARKDKVA